MTTQPGDAAVHRQNLVETQARRLVVGSPRSAGREAPERRGVRCWVALPTRLRGPSTVDKRYAKSFMTKHFRPRSHRQQIAHTVRH